MEYKVSEQTSLRWNMTKGNVIVVLMAFLGLCFVSSAQNSVDPKSTADLSFLKGNWTVERVYQPKSDSPRVLVGTLKCGDVMKDQFIQCTYDMERPGKQNALDVVYFNYNSIYDTYESLWLSSTWPIKVLMKGQMEQNSDGVSLTFTTQFPIENGITEYVKSYWTVQNVSSDSISINRKTMIRTSEDQEDQWLHWMDEKVTPLR